MSQHGFGNLSSPTSGSDLIDTALEPSFNAIYSLHSGSSRPTYAVAGTMWLDTTTTPWILKVFDGTDDITLGTINSSTNVFIADSASSVSDAAITLAKLANLAQDQFIGRTTASTGVPQTATITAAARTVLDDTSVSVMRTTLGVAIGADVQAYNAGLDAATAAWTSYTPTVTSQSGTLTATASISGSYKQIGKTVFFAAFVSITTNGTGASGIQFTLPVTAKAGGPWAITGRETATVGFGLTGAIGSGGTSVVAYKYDATYPGGNGYGIAISGTYEAA